MSHDPTVRALVERLTNALGEDTPHAEVCDALAEMLAARVVKLDPRVAAGTTSARCDVTVEGAPLRVMVFRETPEMRAYDSQRPHEVT
mgnify:CR=1 FL=1